MKRPTHKRKGHNIPAIFRRWTSKSSALATGSSQGSVLDRLVNVWVLHRRRRVSQKASFRGRCQTCLSKSNKMRKGTVNKMSCSKVCMAGQGSMSERMMVQRVLGRWAVYLIGETNHMTKGNYRGYPPWVHFLFMFSFLTDGVMVVWCFSTNPTPGDDITPSREVSYKKRVTHCLTFIACSSTWNTEDWLMWKTSRLVRYRTSIGNHLSCFSRNGLSTTTSGGMWCVRSDCYRNVPWQDGRKYLAMTGNGIKWWGTTGIAGQAIVTTAIDSWTTDCP